MSIYLTGTEVQNKNGSVKKKLSDGSWIGRNRYIAMQKILHRDLLENERVYHLDGDKANDEPENLAVIKFQTKLYKLQHSRVVFAPQKDKNYKMWNPSFVKALAAA
jgi:hypothetical protein